MEEKKEWYLEYEIKINRPGLLGDISSLLGMLSINIITINGIDQGSRGLLILSTKHQIERLALILQTMETINLVKLREPTLWTDWRFDMDVIYKETQMIRKLFVLFVTKLAC